MNATEISKLRFRRQYLVTPEPVECPFLNVRYRLNDQYELYAHVDLPVTEQEKDDLKILLLGDMFDYEDPRKGNQSILTDLLIPEFSSFLKATAKYAGRYVLIYLKADKLYFVADATTTRKVFYSEKGDKLWFASQPHLLASLLGYENTTDPSRLSWYNSKMSFGLSNANIGDMTIYDEVRQLTANRYLDVSGKSVHRFWPETRVDLRPVAEVAAQCAAIIKGTVESIIHRYDVMIPVTAGKDSRLLMSGTTDVRERAFYYLNHNEKMHEKHPDIAIPRKLLGSLNLDFHLLPLPELIDEDFTRIYLQNNKMANKKYLPHIYNYYLNYQDKVNLPAIFAGSPWGKNALHENKVTPDSIANLYGVQEFEFAVAYFRDWLDGCQALCRELNIRTVALFYWEERIANGYTQIQLDKDIAQEDINPLNSRLLNELFIAVKLKYNNMPDYLIFKKTIKELWPELLNYPINPSFRRSVQQILKSAGLLDMIFWMMYPNARK